MKVTRLSILALTMIIDILFDLRCTHANSTDQRWWPLEPGAAWCLFDGREGWEVLILGREDDVFLVRYQFVASFGDGPLVVLDSLDLRLREQGSEIDIEIQPGEFHPYVRFDRESFTRRDADFCWDDVEIAVDTVDSIEVPAGRFSQCRQLFLVGPQKCFDNGTETQVFCPDIGLVHWSSIIPTGVERSDLRSATQIDWPFRRGDVNADAEVDISDAVLTLNFLFDPNIDPDVVQCRDAADVNDDGTVDISDPIYSLNYLFVDGPGIPTPTEECGDDPTEDDLRCLSHLPCVDTREPGTIPIEGESN